MTCTGPPGPTGAGRTEAGPHRTLQRSRDDRVIAGVAGGLARHLDIDPFVVRAGFVIGSLLLGGLPGPLLYALAWTVVPEDGKTTSIASERLGAPPWLS